MNNNNNNRSSSSSCESGRALKWLRAEEEEEEDRLSHLPDPIVHHILSFLDTKSSVQTSVLSRSWRSAWKHVPVIDLLSGSFIQYSSFQLFVDNVLSLHHPSSLRSMVFTVSREHHAGSGDWEKEEGGEGDAGFVAKVAEYALSGHAQHVVFDLLGIMGLEASSGLSRSFATISNRSLRTLKLSGVWIDSGFGSCGFEMLESLELWYCHLVSDKNGVFDSFSSFPSMEKLVLVGCFHLDRHHAVGRESHLKISGPRLLHLELDVVWFSTVEVIAPRLLFFDVRYVLEAQKFSKLSFPCLRRAVVQIEDESGFMEGNEELVAQCLISLFRGLSNVSKLMLDLDTLKILSSINFELLEQQKSSPFARLKSVIVKTNGVPSSLLDHILQGSSATPTTLHFV